MTEKTLRPIVCFGFFAFLLGLASASNDIDLDVFHELALIREGLQLGRLPTTDCFAYTPTIYPVVHHEWGTGAILYWVVVSLGLGGSGLLLLKYALCAFIAIGCFVCARRRGATDPVLAFLLPFGVGLWGLAISTIRAQVFTLAFLVCLLLFFTENDRGKRWWLALWFPLFVVWLNMHAGFLVGLGLFGVYTLEKFLRLLFPEGTIRSAFLETRHLWLTFALLLCLVIVNPYGVDYLNYLRYAVLMPRPNVPEWRPLMEAGSWAIIVLFLLSLVLVAYAALSRGLRNCQGIFLLLVTMFLSLQHFRHITLYGVIWCCVLPAWTSQTSLGEAMAAVWRRRRFAFCILWILFGVGGVTHATLNRFWELTVPTHVPSPGVVKESFPAGAVDYLAANQFQGNLMATYQTGAFISWKLYPAVRVSIDSRYEVAYPPELALEILHFYQAAEGWQQTLRKYPTDAVLVPASRPVAALLSDAPCHTGDMGWQEVYRDDAYSIFLRQALAADYPKVDRRGETIVGAFP